MVFPRRFSPLKNHFCGGEPSWLDALEPLNTISIPQNKLPGAFGVARVPKVSPRRRVIDHHNLLLTLFFQPPNSTLIITGPLPSSIIFQAHKTRNGVFILDRLPKVIQVHFFFIVQELIYLFLRVIFGLFNLIFFLASHLFLTFYLLLLIL